MKASFTYYSRKAHRYLGIFIGIQFLLWTLGGLYFSWTNIEQIRGEHLKKEIKPASISNGFASPDTAIAKIKNRKPGYDLVKIELVTVLDEHFYEIVVSDKNGKEDVVLANVKNGEIREMLSESEAIKVASSVLVERSDVSKVELLKQRDIGGHHEYREKPLPAYAVTFEKPSDLTVYIAARTGRVESFRTNRWRVFDFLWMLHTMDYNGRDNINNYVLRGFSILGIVTILSGFVLFFVTSPFFRRKKGVSK